MGGESRYIKKRLKRKQEKNKRKGQNMKKHTKKVLAVMLAILMTSAILPFGVSAAELSGDLSAVLGNYAEILK